MDDENKPEETNSPPPPADTDPRHAPRKPWWKRIDWPTIFIILGLLVLATSAGHLIWTGLTIVSWEISTVVAVALLTAIFVVIAYLTRWQWTGFTEYRAPKAENEELQRGKTLWDWLQLLFIPTVLAVAALMFNARSSRVEREVAADTQREAMLQSYIDKMSELMLDKNLRKTENSEARNLAQTRTVAVLRRLDGERRGIVLQFLKASDLIKTDANFTKSIIDLTYIDLSNTVLVLADLRQVNLSNAVLNYANLGSTRFDGSMLIGTDFEHARLVLTRWKDVNASMTGFESADLRYAFFSDANFSYAGYSGANLESTVFERVDLSNANFEGADLTGATLNEVNLKDAKITPEQLSKCKSLKGVTMPDGSKRD